MASGDRLSTAPKRKPPGKKTVKLSQKEQSERFREAARELEVDEGSDAAFEAALDVIKKAKP